VQRPSISALTIDTPPEVELLLCCARTLMDPESAEQAKVLLRKDIDWEHLIQTSHFHKMMPFLYSTLNAVYPEAVPKTVLTRFRENFHDNAQHNLSLTAELLKLLNVFEVHGIPALPYKGPALAASAYGSLLLRQFGDLDLLIHKRDAQRANDRMCAEGYHPQYHPDYASKFVRSDGGVLVELHTEITWMKFPVELDFDDLWAHRKQENLAGTTISTLSPEDLLPILCVHGAKHCWTRLAWSCDVAFHIHRNPSMDWERVFEMARRMSGERILSLGLLLAHELGATLPQEAQQRIESDSTAKSLAVQVYQRLLSEDNYDPRENKKFLFFRESDLFYLRVRERFRDKLTYLLHFCKVAPNEKDIDFVQLPNPLFFLYYLLRPFRLVETYGLRPLRRYLTQLLRPRR
jgi:hypothetical protein